MLRQLDVRLTRTERDLPQAVSAYDALARAGAPAPIATHPDFVRLGWLDVAAREPGARLCIVTIHDGDGRPLMVWPLYSFASGGLRIIRHPGSGSKEEYAGPVLAAGSDAVALVAAALDALKAEGDVLEVYNLPAADPVAKALAGNRRKWLAGVSSPIISVSGFASGEDWRKSKSANFRQQIRAKRKRLGQIGPVTASIAGADEIADYVDWTFAHKDDWTQQRSIQDSWIARDETRAFFKHLLTEAPDIAIGTQIKVGEERVAGVILFMGETAEFFTTVYDPKFGAYSPGLLALDHVVDLACERGLDVDLRLTTDSYKLRWADRYEPRQTIFVALTGKGMRPILAARLRTLVRNARRFASSLVKRLRSRKAA